MNLCSHRSIIPLSKISHRRVFTRSPLLQRNVHTGSAKCALDGITVVSVEQAIAAPFCTRQLADLGARVIKIERPVVGDFCRHLDTRANGTCSHFVWTNRNKESVALDLKKDTDLQVLKTLLQKADVFVQNLAPGAAARMGLSYAVLKNEHPSLIVCDISGYGQDGPYREKKAYDLLIQSEAGVLDVTGTQNEPVKVGLSIADIAAGMYAYSNILSALFQRTRTGKGKWIDISMLESMVEWMGFPLYYAWNGASRPQPNGAAHASIYPYGPFPTGSGETVMLGIQNEREWKDFCVKVLQRPDLLQEARYASNSARCENRDELGRLIGQVFGTLTTEQIIDRLDRAPIANGKVNTLKDVWAHPQLKARHRWRTVKTPTGEVESLLPPGIAKEEDTRMDEVPAVGQHTTAITNEFSSCLQDRALGESVSSDAAPRVVASS